MVSQDEDTGEFLLIESFNPLSDIMGEHEVKEGLLLSRKGSLNRRARPICPLLPRHAGQGKGNIGENIVKIGQFGREHALISASCVRSNPLS